VRTRMRSGIGAASLCVLLLLGTGPFARAQSSPDEKAFPKSRREIENALKSMQSRMAGRLPILEGFATAAEHPLEKYQRGYYQATAEVVPGASGKDCVVRIKVKVTAWYGDSSGTHSGYQLLRSNGRIEADLLDQLSEQLAVVPAEKVSPSAPSVKTPQVANGEPSAPEPLRTFPSTIDNLSSSLKQDLPRAGSDVERFGDSTKKTESALQTEAANLEEILKNTGHPHNLVAVRKSGTPVVSTPSLTAKPQFLASMHDEFELLDFNADWVHVRISGLSRGWIWRNSVEMPDGISDSTASSAATVRTAAGLFRVVREEAAPFPGDWEPLRGRNVKIISVQKTDEASQNTGLAARLEYTKFLLEKNYNQIADEKHEVQGVVVVFDSADGGMIGATLPVLQQWRAGTLTDSALWHKCFFDPPETLDSAGSAGSK